MNAEPEAPSGRGGISQLLDVALVDAISAGFAGLEGTEESSINRRQRAQVFADRVGQSLFHRRGYVFVFRKSSSTMNIQFRELLSLLSIHARYRGVDERVRGLQFSTTTQLQSELVRAWDSYFLPPIEGGRAKLTPLSGAEAHPVLAVRPRAEGESEATYNEYVADKEKLAFFAKDKLTFQEELDMFGIFGSLYSQFLANTIILDSYATTALAYPSIVLDVDLKRICGESGYILSCGSVIYFRNADKATYAEFEGKLVKFLDEHPAEDKVSIFPVSVYAHESYSQNDDELTRRKISGGVSNLKIHLRKQYLGTSPLPVSLARRAASPQIAGRIEILPGKEDHRDEQKKFIERHRPAPGQENNMKARDDARIWIFLERPLEEKEQNRYLACYAQFFANESPLILFDEEKPGWLAPVTLPHSLAAAMVNIARPYFRRSAERGSENVRPLIAVDPFVGSGTVIFELMKLEDVDVTIYANDLHTMGAQIVADNFRFIPPLRRTCVK